MSVTLFDVIDDFPKLTRGEVHPGISEARYEISVGAISTYELNIDIEEILGHG